MQFNLVKENEDGSGVFTIDMTAEEQKMLILFGLKCALEAAVKEGKFWDATEEVQALQENAGLSD